MVFSVYDLDVLRVFPSVRKWYLYSCFRVF